MIYELTNCILIEPTGDDQYANIQPMGNTRISVTISDKASLPSSGCSCPTPYIVVKGDACPEDVSTLTDYEVNSPSVQLYDEEIVESECGRKVVKTPCPVTIIPLSDAQFATICEEACAEDEIPDGAMVLFCHDGKLKKAPLVDTDTNTEYVFTPNTNGTTSVEAFDIDGNSLGIQVIGHELWPYKQNAANTMAEVSAASGKGIDAGSTEWLTTNRMTDLASSGPRNPNGTLGSFMWLDGFENLNGQTIQSDYNNPILFRGIINSGETATLAAANREYQNITLAFFGADGVAQNTYADINLPSGVNLRGVLRDTNNVIKKFDSADTTFRVRVGESVSFFATSINEWYAIDFNYNLLSGPGWHENEDGTVDMWGFASTDSVNNPVATGSYSTGVAALPLALVNTTSLSKIQITSRGFNPGGLDNWIDISRELSLDNNAQFGFAAFSPIGQSANHGIDWHLKGGVLA